jgi:hypothetical protein
MTFPPPKGTAPAVPAPGIAPSVRHRRRTGPDAHKPANQDIDAIRRADPKLDIVYLPIDQLHAAPRNARTHSAKQVQQIATSIKQFGFVNPILVDAENRMVAGHGRLAAAKLLGRTQVPTVRLAHMTAAQLRAYRLADNRLAQLSGWDPELLAIELAELSETDLGFEVELIGWSTAEIDLLLPDSADDADDGDPPPPQPQARAVSRSGDIWVLGAHRILCGDARDQAEVERLLAGELAQMVFTDPPYNVPVQGHVSGLGKVQHREFAMASGEMSEAQFTAFLAALFNILAAVSVDGAIQFVCMDWRHMKEVIVAGSDAYTEMKNLCVWNKDNGGMGSFYRSKHELVFVYKNGTAPHINNFGLGEHGRYRTNVWDYAGANTFRRGRADDLALHPTVKPVAMVMDAIKDCSRRNGIVLDAFGGSGTTLIAAHRTGRRGYLVEIDPLYVDVTIRRWQQLTGLPATLAGTGATFDATQLDRLGGTVPVEADHV